ncbi:hypothetical protein LPICM17_480008 [Lactococcus piscium]|nr:hypothetical protein LPICM17_480008 [Lactococcus piscium]
MSFAHEMITLFIDLSYVKLIFVNVYKNKFGDIL